MPAINLREVDAELFWKLKAAASLEQKSLRDWAIEVLQEKCNGISGNDVRATGSGQTDEAQRGGDDATLPDVPKAKSTAKRLHTLYPVRDELAGGGGSLKGCSPQPCATHPSKSYKHGAEWFCPVCAR